MTITLVPDPNPRRTDRGPKARLHEGPYYGRELRRALTERPEVDHREIGWAVVTVLIIGVVVIAAVVML